ncbi:MAG: sugar ABC transporter permease [Ignavibacteriaceae bacterium]
MMTFIEHIKHPLKRRQALAGYSFISPWLIGFLVFGLYPICMSVYYSLCKYDVLRIPQFIGFRNYSDLLFNDNYFWVSIWNTLFFTALRVPLVIVGSLLLAVLVNNAIKGVKIFRTIYFIPSIITGVILSSLWLWM